VNCQCSQRYPEVRCIYCEVALSSRHEHDHTPVPKALGGKEAFPVCLNCHDLKDRIPTHEWPLAAFRDLLGSEGWGKTPPLVKVFVAQMATTIATQLLRRQEGEAS
jgi:hypothetical protein